MKKKVLLTASLVSTAMTMGGCGLFEVWNNQNRCVYGPPPDDYVTVTPVVEEPTMTEKNLRWNRFVEDVCFRDMDTLSEIQKNAVLCFWYDAEMNSGGYSGYMDCYPDTDPEELTAAILAVSYQEIADNYQKAVTEGEQDDWVETDLAYYKFSPSLCECLEEYVEKNRDVIFE